MMYNPSVNIELGVEGEFNYILTPNAQAVLESIITGFQIGIRSYSIIGAYGTGKSSFLLALEQDLQTDTNRLVKDKTALGKYTGYEFINIVGQYAPLASLLQEKVDALSTETTHNIVQDLRRYFKTLRAEGKLLFIVIDEFGKILEYAAHHNPEKELYFIQTLTEVINVSGRNVILLTTLHQNFGTYAGKLTEAQRNEWLKVKGRFKDIVFAEPVEQLLYLAAEGLRGQSKAYITDPESFTALYRLARESKAISSSLDLKTAQMLYPLDPLAASCLTLAIQRYGQNERTLFSFLSDLGPNAIRAYQPSKGRTYNLTKVYDYIIYNFYSSLTETNLDSTNWRAIRVAIERVENLMTDDGWANDCVALVKCIGLLNLFYSAITVNKDFLATYGNLALGIANTDRVIEKLAQAKIIRYATYKSQYILFEGTDINIEEELCRAASLVPPPTLAAHELQAYFRGNVALATASYYKTGTSRYFVYSISNEPITDEPKGDVDGYINLVFPQADIKQEVLDVSQSCGKAILYAYFEDAEAVTNCLFEIKKLQYLLDHVVQDDNIAKTEVINQQAYEEARLNKLINDSSTLYSGQVCWIFQGHEVKVRSRNDLNKLLSYICDKVYYLTPIVRNELFNKQKISSAISQARVNLLDAMLEHWQEEDFGFSRNNFPPEKTIYYTLFKNTGIHHTDQDNTWVLGDPTANDIKTLWDVSVNFLRKSTEKALNLTQFVKDLEAQPYKLKQGFVDFWIPMFLFIKQQEFSLYHGDTFVLNIGKEVFDLLQKRLKDFSVRAFDITDVKLELFNKYRLFLNKETNTTITTNGLMDTIRPFFQFYKKLNPYAKSTYKFDTPTTAPFRDVLARATDPCKAFLEDIPEALGYHDITSASTDQYLQQIRIAVHELVVCYDNFIDRIETNVVEQMGLPEDYQVYKPILKDRYKNIKPSLLTPKTRSFLSRVLSPSATKKEFYEKIGLTVFDKRVDSLKDKDEPLFINNLLHLFRELERYSSFEAINEAVDAEAYNFEMASSQGDFISSQTYRLPKAKALDAENMEQKIKDILSGDPDLDICVLLKVLKQKMK